MVALRTPLQAAMPTAITMATIHSNVLTGVCRILSPSIQRELGLARAHWVPKSTVPWGDGG